MSSLYAEEVSENIVAGFLRCVEFDFSYDVPFAAGFIRSVEF